MEQQDKEERLKGVYGFNQLVSDEISLNRTVPDTREEVRYSTVTRTVHVSLYLTSNIRFYQK